MKKEFLQNKNNEIKKKQEEVKLLKNKENINFMNYQKSLKISQLVKKKIKEQEKKCIKENLIKIKNKKSEEIEERKKIKKEKEKKTAEVLRGNRVYALTKIKNDLESKIKVQKTINNKTRKQYINVFKLKLNNEIFQNSI